MGVPLGGSGDFPGGLDQIETDWSMVHEPAHVVMRYAPAVQKYLRALIKNEHDAEEAAQDFFLWVSQHGLPRTRRDRGRFRDYLKAAVRNSAFNFLRRTRPALQESDISQIPDPDGAVEALDREWIGQWRRCITKRAWRRLRDHEKKTRNQIICKVLRLCVNNPGEKSEILAEKLSEMINKPVRADAFRQQVSRARRQFACYLVDEVAQTLSDAEPANVEDELADLGLMEFVRDFLPLRRRISKS